MGLLDSDDEFYDTKMGSNVSIAHHALSIDEQREDFAPTIWQSRPGVDLKQVWFAGVHAAIGGSYPPAKKGAISASDTPLKWMLDEARAAGLIIESRLLEGLAAASQGKLHKSRKHVYRFKRPRHRQLLNEEKPTKIHPSVKARYEEDPSYRPPQLKALVEQYGWHSLDVGI